MMSASNESKKVVSSKLRASSRLSDFVTKYSAAEKKAIFDKVIEGAIAAQKEVLAKAEAMTTHSPQ